MNVTRNESRAAAAPSGSSGAVGLWPHRVFWAGVLAQCAIVVTGALVRLTASGLGCPTWPQCAAQSYAPLRTQVEGYHRYIEFGNRLLTFALGIVLVACVVAAWRHRPRRRPLVVLAALGFAGIFAQALLGGVTVLTGLNPWSVAAHFLLSLALIALSVALLQRGADDGDAPPVTEVRTELRVLGRVLIATALIVLTLGTAVTGSGPHSGDADTPARFPFDPRSISWLHADAVLIFVGLIVALVLALHLTDAPRTVRHRSWFLAAAVAAQGSVGYAQYFTGLPWVVVALHVLGACVVWVATLRVYFAMRSRASVVTAK